jgi:hypothetical protein
VEEILSKKGLDWSCVLKQAKRHGVSPLLYQSLKQYTQGLVSAEALEELRKVYYAILAKNMALYSELEKILDSFSREGIEVILLKGAAFATTLYPDIGLRPMKDLDILIHKKDIERAKKEVAGLGYSFDPISLDLKKKDLPLEEYYLLHHPHLPPFYKKKGHVFLEVHWALTSKTMPYKFDTPGLWERAVEETISGRMTRVLSTEDALVYMCAHVARHRFSAGLREYHDILMLTHRIAQWNRVTDLACENHLKTPVYYALLYTSQLYKAKVPLECTNRLKPGPLRATLFKSLTNTEASMVFGQAESDAGLLIDLLLIDRHIDMLRFLVGRLFPPTPWMSIKYRVPMTKRNIFFYYLRRICYLATAALRYPILRLKKGRSPENSP